MYTGRTKHVGGLRVNNPTSRASFRFRHRALLCCVLVSQLRCSSLQPRGSIIWLPVLKLALEEIKVKMTSFFEDVTPCNLARLPAVSELLPPSIRNQIVSLIQKSSENQMNQKYEKKRLKTTFFQVLTNNKMSFVDSF